MPLYNLACRTALDTATRQRVAEAVTDAHCTVTGAPAQFVNVMFVHGYPLRDGEEISAIGGVRQGGNRTPEVIEKLRAALQSGIATASGKSAGQVVVTLIGVPSSWVLEGGRVMPEPGEEKEWLEHHS